MGGRGSISGGSPAFQKAVRFVNNKGIPAAFYAQSVDDRKDVFRAISIAGKLNNEEQAIFEKVQVFREENRVWYNGTSRDITGYTEAEINGVKKFIAHSAYMKTKRG